MHVAQAKQGAGTIGRWFSQIFPGTQQKVEAENEAIGPRSGLRGVFELCSGIDLGNHGKREGQTSKVK